MLPDAGFTVVRGVLPNASALAERVEEQITLLAADLSATPQDYLSAVSVWRRRSPVVAAIRADVERAVLPLASEFGCTRLAKLAVVRKSRFAPLATVAHQDACYPNAEPYQLSVWLALDHVSPDHAPLQFLPGSHRRPPSPWVDYWKPDFVDDRVCSDEWISNAETVCVRAGDAVIFDPFLWHASAPLAGDVVRRAVTMRWTRDGAQWAWPIPVQPHQGFGMMTCRPMTEAILRERWRWGSPPPDFGELVEAWSARTGDASFRHLAILHRANLRHDAGDQQGRVHATVWNRLNAGVLESWC